MWSTALRFAVAVAKKVPWWKILGMEAGRAAATAIGSKIVYKILQDKSMSFEEKLERQWSQPLILDIFA